MKNWKKATAAVLCGVVAAGLCGCGNGGQDAKDHVAINKTGYPIVDEKLTIKVMAPNWNNTKEYNQKSLVQDLEKKTNIHVEWQYFTGDASEKLSLAFASKENIPDAFLMSDMPSNTIDKYGKDGLIIPVENLIEQYAPNINSAMNEDIDAKKMATSRDGHMYAVPSLYRSPAEKIRGVTIINKKWLAELGLDVPATTDEFYEVLKAFKGKDLNGNGEEDEIPLLLYWDNNTSGVASLFGSWGVSSAYTGSGGSAEAGPFFVKNGKVVVSNMQEEYKEAVKYFHKLYSEGLINKDAFTGERTNVEARQKADPSVAGATNIWSIASAGTRDKSIETYTLVPPLRGPNGEQNVFKPVFGVFANNYISGNTDAPEAIIRWMDTTADPDTSYEWNVGPIGRNLDKRDGKYIKIPTPEGKDSVWAGEENFQFPVMGLTERWFTQNVDFTGTPSDQYKIDNNESYLPFASMMTVEHLKYNEEQRKTLEAVLPQIIDYSKQKEAEWITNGSIDEEWDAHIKQLESMKISEVQKIMQDAQNYWDSID